MDAKKLGNLPVGQRPWNNLDGGEAVPHYGITLRQHFAGVAMQGALANPDHAADDYEEMAKCSVQQADALLDELAKDL
jgi:hypothetical protein